MVFHQTIKQTFCKLVHRKKLALFTVLLGGLSVLSQPSMAEETGERQITVVSSSDSQLSVDFKPKKAQFDVNEAIEFSVSGNQTFFLYVYTKNADDSYTLILPNKFQSGNKYQAGDAFTVPNANVKFFADGSSAVEPVFAIASTQYIDLKAASNKSVGDFTEIDNKVMEQRFRDKGIKIQDAPSANGQTEIEITEAQAAESTTSNNQQNTAPTQVERAVLTRVDIEITGVSTQTQENTTIVQDDTDPIIVFVTSGDQQYQNGGKIHFIYGANTPGDVEIYFVDPDGDGAKEPVHRQAVDGNSIYTLSATHEGSSGKHIIRAKYVDTLSSSKQLKLDEPAEEPSIMAEHTLEIE